VGLLLGSLGDISAWLFAATAGVFLYVALVDMMPELNSGTYSMLQSWINTKAKCCLYWYRI
jgi:zinc transporter ZupT